MKATKLVLGLFDHAFDGLVIGDAVRVRDRLAACCADFLRHFFGRACIALIGAGQAATEIVHHNLRAGLCCQQRALLADPVAAAGDQYDFSIQNAHVFLLACYIHVLSVFQHPRSWIGKPVRLRPYCALRP